MASCILCEKLKIYHHGNTGNTPSRAIWFYPGRSSPYATQARRTLGKISGYHRIYWLSVDVHLIHFLSYTIRGLLPIEQSSGFSSVAYAFTYLILALIYFIPLLYLYQFAVNTQRAIHKQQPHELTHAFSRLKSFYQYLGILTIICIAFYVVVVIGVYIGLKMS